MGIVSAGIRKVISFFGVPGSEFVQSLSITGCLRQLFCRNDKKSLLIEPVTEHETE
jgi:hypothetical protein